MSVIGPKHVGNIPTLRYHLLQGHSAAAFKPILQPFKKSVMLRLDRTFERLCWLQASHHIYLFIFPYSKMSKKSLFPSALTCPPPT